MGGITGIADAGIADIVAGSGGAGSTTGIAGNATGMSGSTAGATSSTGGTEKKLETRVALIGIVVEDAKSVDRLNEILHQYSKYIIGRMGLPYHKRGINIISIAMDAPANDISALSGKLGMLPGISSKAVYSKLPGNKETSGGKP